MRETVRKFKETVEIKSSLLNRLRSHRYFPLIVLFVVFLSTACFHIWQRFRVMNLVKEISVLKAENSSLTDDKKKLYSEIASLATASRIEKYASDTLGLKPVPADRLLTLVKKDNSNSTPNDIELMFSALQRVTDLLPVIEQTRANARGVEDIEIDSTSNNWGAK